MTVHGCCSAMEHPGDPLLVGVPERSLIDGVEQAGRVLGRGSYGVVFEGQWRGTRVAIKRHHYILVRDDNGHLSSPYRRFLEEFSVLKELPHPNIVQVFGMVPPTFPQDTPGLVMECLHETLRKRYAESPLLSRLDEATVALGVVSALGYLHSRRVVHRDLTTNNIMVCDAAGTGGEVKAKITDVGGAAVMADGAQAESMSLNPGAQIYMAPETQRRSTQEGKARYGPPADCYSCALSVMAMCNRREPPNILTLQHEGRAADLALLGEGHPLHGIIVRCLEADPSLRPTASQLCSEIAEVRLHMKDVPAEQNTAATPGGETTDEQAADNPDLVFARAEIANLQHAVTVIDGERVNLLAERDGLLAGRDVMEFIATEHSHTGMLARCSLLRPPNLDRRSPSTLPKWVAVGDVPACHSVGTVQAVRHNKLHIMTCLRTNEIGVLSAPLDNLCKDNWTKIDQPQEIAVGREAILSLLSYKGVLYGFSTSHYNTSSDNFWKRNDQTSAWEKVARLPQYRCGHGLSIVGDCIVVAGGSSSSDRTTSARPSVISLSLVEDGADWVAWPDWPSAQVRWMPNIATAAGKVHIIGGEMNNEGPAAVLTADLSLPPKGRIWSTATIPRPPTPQCAAVVANDHLVVCGGQSSLGRSCKSYMYSAVSKTWLPLPDILTKYIVGIYRPTLHSTDHGILMVSHHGIAGLRW